MEKILFIKPQKSSFIQNDETILKKHFNVKSFEYGTKAGFSAIVAQIRLFFFLLFNIISCKIIFIWFADYYGFFPILFSRIFKKKSVVVIGGFDAIKSEEFNYGGFLKPFRSKIIRYICKNANILLPVSEYTATKLNENLGFSVEKKSKIIHNCIETEYFKPSEEIKKSNSIITVCGTSKISTAKLKGLEEFAQAAKELPHYQFIIVGLEGEAFQKYNDCLPNLQVYKRKSKPELLELYRNSKVICQLSYIESFGVALGEAMCCGCVPVCMDGIGTSEIVTKDCGFVVSSRNQHEINQLIEEAISKFELLKHKSIQRINNTFTPIHRESKLLKELKF